MGESSSPRRRWTKVLVGLIVVAAVAAPAAVWAGHRFTDVPDTNIFHDDISAIADAGVTIGCNPPANDEYCPGDFVTREQMAAFMNRLGALAPGKTPVVNAAQLEGQDGVAYSNPINGTACEFGDCPDGAALEIIPVLSLEVDAPAAGVLQISYLLQAAISPASGDLVQAWVALDQTDNQGCGGWFFAPVNPVLGTYGASELDGTINFTTLSGAAAVEVSSGSHTLVLCGLGGAALDTQVGSLTTIWSQTGSGVAAAATSSASEGELAPLQESLGDVEPEQ
ncbi:MAG: S-layer homology domain-containing protein [Acidimicrobiia bacterium]